MIMSSFLHEAQKRMYSKWKCFIAGIQCKINSYLLFWKSQMLYFKDAFVLCLGLNFPYTPLTQSYLLPR
jgi:hypothetical protein